MKRIIILLLVVGCILLLTFWPDPKANNLCCENYQHSTTIKWWSMWSMTEVTVGPVLVCDMQVDGPAARYDHVYGITGRFPSKFLAVYRSGGIKDLE